MARPSTSPAPIAQLRRLLGADFTAAFFARRHKLRLDHLKKVESPRAKDVLSEAHAKEIGLTYGVRPSSLQQKIGPVIAVDGRPATVEKIRAWQKHAMSQGRLAEEHEKALALAASRQIYELFRAAGGTGDAFALAASFDAWREVQLGSKKLEGLARAFDERVNRTRFVNSRTRSGRELRKILGEAHPLLKDVVDTQQVDSEVTCREKPVPLISFVELQGPEYFNESDPSSTQLALVIGKKSRQYDVKLHSGELDPAFCVVVRETFSLLLREEGNWKSLRCSAVIRCPNGAPSGRLSSQATPSGESPRKPGTGGPATKSGTAK